LVGTRDGQKAAGEIQARFGPKKAEFDRRQGEITQMQEQLNKGRNTMSEEAQQKMTRDIDQKTKALTRDTEDAQAELSQEEQKIMGQLGNRLNVVIDRYAKDNGYTLILDVSSPQTPVLFASNAINITKDIIDLYDKNATPPTGAAAPPVSAPKPAAAAPKPVAPKK